MRQAPPPVRPLRRGPTSTDDVTAFTFALSRGRDYSSPRALPGEGHGSSIQGAPRRRHPPGGRPRRAARLAPRRQGTGAARRLSPLAHPQGDDRGGDREGGGRRRAAPTLGDPDGKAAATAGIAREHPGARRRRRETGAQRPHPPAGGARRGGGGGSGGDLAVRRSSDPGRRRRVRDPARRGGGDPDGAEGSARADAKHGRRAARGRRREAGRPRPEGAHGGAEAPGRGAEATRRSPEAVRRGPEAARRRCPEASAASGGETARHPPGAVRPRRRGPERGHRALRGVHSAALDALDLIEEKEPVRIHIPTIHIPPVAQHRLDSASSWLTRVTAPRPPRPEPLKPPPPVSELPSLRLAPLEEGRGQRSPWPKRQLLIVAAVLGGLGLVATALAWLPRLEWLTRKATVAPAPAATPSLQAPEPPLPPELQLAAEQLPHLAPETIRLVASTIDIGRPPDPPEVFRRADVAANRGASALTQDEARELRSLKSAAVGALRPVERERVLAYGRVTVGRDLMLGEDARVLLLYARAVRTLSTARRER